MSPLTARHYANSLRFAKEVQDKELAVSAEILIGSTYYWLGEYDAALIHYRSSLHLRMNCTMVPQKRADSLPAWRLPAGASKLSADIET
jgi:hypothetical protein